MQSFHFLSVSSILIFVLSSIFILVLCLQFSFGFFLFHFPFIFVPSLLSPFSLSLLYSLTNEPPTTSFLFLPPSSTSRHCLPLLERFVFSIHCSPARHLSPFPLFGLWIAKWKQGISAIPFAISPFPFYVSPFSFSLSPFPFSLSPFLFSLLLFHFFIVMT